MLSIRRPLALAAAFQAVFATAALAQTVFVTNAPRGEKVEVVLGGKPAGTATVDSAGVATIPVNMVAATGANQMDARVYVDVCPQLHRILVTERNQLPAAKDDACDRREIAGIFWVRPVNSLVINVGGAIPTMLLARGRYDVNNPAPPKRSPSGLVIFGGGGLGKINDVVSLACGNVSECSGDDSPSDYTAGVAYWIRPWLGAEASYLRPSEVTVNGNGGDFTFSTEFDVHVFTAVANVGIPAGPVRIYGKVGANFHSARTIARQTTGEETPETQTSELQTEGWGPVYGAGFEGWIKPAFGIYVEAAFGTLKGKPTERTVEGDLDAGFRTIVAGIRLRLF